MKTAIRHTLGVVALSTTLLLARADDASPAGQIDFAKFKAPANGGQFVEVNLKEDLIAMAARLTQGQEPEIAQLLRGLKRVHVNVVGLDDGNRTEVNRQVETLRKELSGAGWDRVVTVREKDQDVGVYIKLRGEEAVEGLVVTVLDGKEQAVLVNIVGNIRPEQLTLIGERFDIEPLKKIGPLKKS